jgi:hypothetical protein
MRLAVLAGLLLSLAAGAAAGAPPAPAAPPVAPLPPKTVSPLTVYPLTDPPKLISSYPAAGETIAPGVLVVRLSFDQPMVEDSFDVTPGPDAAAPKCLKTPRRLNDEKSFVLLCTIAPNSRYALALNAGARGGFANLGGTRAEPATLAFSTNDSDRGPRSVPEAMKAAKLTELDMPIREGMYF